MVSSVCAPPVGLVSVALLLPATGSVTPTGGATVAVLVSGPVVAAGTVPVTVKVAWVPGDSVTSASMLPVPEAVPQLAPAPLGVQVQVKPASGAGSASCTWASTTFDGPALLTTMV